MTAENLPAGTGLVDLETAKGLSGLELMAGIAEGRFPQPPITAVLGFRLLSAEHGRAVFEGAPGAHLYNPLGSVHGGYAATLLDSCMGCAVHSTLPAGTGYTTLEFKINFVRAMSAATGTVRAEGRVLHPGRRAATAEGRLVDAQGQMLAHATTTCLVLPL